MRLKQERRNASLECLYSAFYGPTSLGDMSHDGFFICLLLLQFTGPRMPNTRFPFLKCPLKSISALLYIVSCSLRTSGSDLGKSLFTGTLCRRYRLSTCCIIFPGPYLDEKLEVMFRECMAKVCLSAQSIDLCPTLITSLSLGLAQLQLPEQTSHTTKYISGLGFELGTSISLIKRGNLGVRVWFYSQRIYQAAFASLEVQSESSTQCI